MLKASKKSFIPVADSTPSDNDSRSDFGAEYPRFTLGGVVTSFFTSRSRRKKASSAEARPSHTCGSMPCPVSWMKPTSRAAASTAAATSAFSASVPPVT